MPRSGLVWISTAVSTPDVESLFIALELRVWLAPLSRGGRIIMRPIWKGALSFGLVNIPVQLNSAIRAGSRLYADPRAVSNAARVEIHIVDPSFHNAKRLTEH